MLGEKIQTSCQVIPKSIDMLRFIHYLRHLFGLSAVLVGCFPSLFGIVFRYRQRSRKLEARKYHNNMDIVLDLKSVLDLVDEWIATCFGSTTTAIYSSMTLRTLNGGAFALLQVLSINSTSEIFKCTLLMYCPMVFVNSCLVGNTVFLHTRKFEGQWKRMQMRMASVV